MSFRVESVLSDGEWLELSSNPDLWNRDNIFTLIVGQNATGKSRLLRKIVSHYIFRDQSSERDRFLHQNPQASWNYYRHLSPEEEVKVGPLSESAPSNVIAVSTGRYDRFPSPIQANKKKLAADYHYIAPSTNGSLSSLTRSLIAIIEGLQDYGTKSSKLADIFIYLDFAPMLDFKFVFEHNEPSEIRPSLSKTMDLLGGDYTQTYLDFDKDDVLDRYTRFRESSKKKNKFNIEINLGYSHLWQKTQELDDILYFLKAGLARVSDLTLIQLKSKSRLRLSQASSGQQCMLTMILGIAGAIRHESLICIDEPEISLHPKWQEDIIRQLQVAFSEYYGCHFIIATHSPQILSGLTTSNGFVLSLEDRRLYQSDEYSRKSADFQLAAIMNAPGQNNEYLIRLVLTILSKISKREELSSEDKRKIIWLAKLQLELAEDDPVWHLIEQAKMLGL